MMPAHIEQGTTYESQEGKRENFLVQEHAGILWF